MVEEVQEFAGNVAKKITFQETAQLQMKNIRETTPGHASSVKKWAINLGNALLMVVTKTKVSEAVMVAGQEDHESVSSAVMQATCLVNAQLQMMNT